MHSQQGIPNLRPLVAWDMDPLPRASDTIGDLVTRSQLVRMVSRSWLVRCSAAIWQAGNGGSKLGEAGLGVEVGRSGGKQLMRRSLIGLVAGLQTLPSFNPG